METEGMASGKKKAARLGAHLVFVDESGFLLIPHRRRTWAPRGVTPILRHWLRHDRVSVISGLSLSPRRRHVGLYYRLHTKNIQQPEVCEFLRYLLRHLRGPVIVLWDNLRQHGGPPIRELCHRFPRLHLERFPPYAPELNPDEGVWTHAKARLANGRPDDILQLRRDVRSGLRALRRSQQNLKACIRHAELPLFLP